MCRSIKPLFHFEQPATEQEIHDAALQFVRKVSGYTTPSKANEAVFTASVDDIAAVAKNMLDSLVTHAPLRQHKPHEHRHTARD